jgi:hypothetical protein
MEKTSPPGPETLAAVAAELGLERLLALDPEGFARAHAASIAYTGKIGRPASIYDEPAHACPFAPPAEGAR